VTRRGLESPRGRIFKSEATKPRFPEASRRASGIWEDLRVPRLRTIAIVAALVVVTDVTWDGTSLHVSFGWPGRKRLVQFVFP
jgi:hypothetical protein